MSEPIVLTPDQVKQAAEIVSDLGWESAAVTECAKVLDLDAKLPRDPCWRDIARAGFVVAVIQVAVELQDTPESLRGRLP